jgi:hypothetical protein
LNLSILVSVGQFAVKNKFSYAVSNIELNREAIEQG